MFDALVLNRDAAEMQIVHQSMRSAAAMLTDADWQWQLFRSSDACMRYLTGGGSSDVSCVDVALDGGIEVAEKIRSQSETCPIVVVANSEISPMVYIKPTIVPSALLLRPFSAEQARQVSNAIIRQMAEREQSDEDFFMLHQKDGTKPISYRQIYYFEAREKKVFVNLGNTEYGFFDTIDNLAERLPADFVRCHRSFIVSKRKIAQIFISRNTIVLDGDIDIPLSRSYKTALKELRS